MTNKAAKGKYKFLQKYYHRFDSHYLDPRLNFAYCRGAFYLNDEEDVLKRDTTGATLEDRFDKTVSEAFYSVDFMRVFCAGTVTTTRTRSTRYHYKSFETKLLVNSSSTPTYSKVFTKFRFTSCG